MSDIELVIANAAMDNGTSFRYGTIPVAIKDTAGGIRYATILIQHGIVGGMVDKCVVINVKGEKTEF